ncbi:MAG: hypothetical protein Q7S33_01585 [Nanoarchaeota archaeon]|nr:hypothetical protein [Nanoarchaeota archaeon]
MKKELAFICIFLFSIFFLSFASAIPSISLNKDSYQPGETILGEILAVGNIEKTISLNDIQFLDYRDKQVFFDYDLVFYNDKYIFYAYATKEGNFTIKINNILYNDGTLKSINLEKKFEVKITNNSEILSIEPGFVFTSNKETTLTLSNKGSSNLNISYSYLASKSSNTIFLIPGDSKKISINPIAELSYETLSFSKENFSIPVIYVPLDLINLTLENSSEIINGSSNSSVNQTKVYVYPKNGTNESIEITKTPCSELNGKICSSNEKCNGELPFTSDGYCCLGTCDLIIIEETSTTSKVIWGILILVFLGVAGFFIYKKVKKTKPANPEEVIDKKSKAYEKRISGGLTKN